MKTSHRGYCCGGLIVAGLSLLLLENAGAENVFEKIARALASGNRDRDHREESWRQDDGQWQQGRGQAPSYGYGGGTVFRGRGSSFTLADLAENSARIVENVFARSGRLLQGRPDAAMVRGFRGLAQGVRSGEDSRNLSQRWTQVESDWVQVRPLVQEINTREAWVAVQEIDGNMAQMRSIMGTAPAYGPGYGSGNRPGYGLGNQPGYGYGGHGGLSAISDLYQFALNLHGTIKSRHGGFATENDHQLATQYSSDFHQWLKVVLENAQAGQNQANLQQPFENAAQVWRQLTPLLDFGSANYGYRRGQGSLQQYRQEGDTLLARAAQVCGR